MCTGRASPGALQGQRRDPRIGRPVDERPRRGVAPREARVFAAAGHEPAHQHEQRLHTQPPADLGRERRFEAARVAATELLGGLRAVLVGVGARVRGRDRRSPPTASVLRDRALPGPSCGRTRASALSAGAVDDQQPRADFFDVARVHGDEAPVGPEGQPARARRGRTRSPIWRRLRRRRRRRSAPGSACGPRTRARRPAPVRPARGRRTRPRPPAAARGTRGPARRSRTGRPAPGRPRCTSPPRAVRDRRRSHGGSPSSGSGRVEAGEALAPRERHAVGGEVLRIGARAASRRGRSRSRPPSRPASASTSASATRTVPRVHAPRRPRGRPEAAELQPELLEHLWRGARSQALTRPPARAPASRRAHAARARRGRGRPPRRSRDPAPPPRRCARGRSSARAPGAARR